MGYPGIQGFFAPAISPVMGKRPCFGFSSAENSALVRQTAEEYRRVSPQAEISCPGGKIANDRHSAISLPYSR